MFGLKCSLRGSVLGAAIILGGCFSDASGVTETDGDGSSGGGETSSGMDSTSLSTSATTASSTGTASTSATTDTTTTTTTTTATTGGMCGDGTIDPGEVCDGSDFGDADCASEGFAGGVLGCAENCGALDVEACIEAQTCCEPYAGRGCDDTECSDAVCADNPLCCEQQWVFECAEAAAELCPSCALPGFCGDGIINGDEVCEEDDLDGQTCEGLGYDNGTLGCGSRCVAFDESNCGNFMCGNGMQEPGEVCDGVDLDGNTCADVGFDFGDLACQGNCMGFDTMDCENYVGNCCIANGTPGCEDDACTTMICGADPFCCDNNWDGTCSDAANAGCAVCMV